MVIMDANLAERCKTSIDTFMEKFLHYSWLVLSCRLKRRSNKVSILLKGKRNGVNFFAFTIIVKEENDLEFLEHFLYTLGHTIRISTSQEDISTECYTDSSDE